MYFVLQVYSLREELELMSVNHEIAGHSGRAV
jgi:hypothetical protein